jgi:GAF domain-containing protein
MKGNSKMNKHSGDQSPALLYRISKAMAAVKDGRELIKIIVAETQSVFGFYDIGLSVLDKSGKFYTDWAVLYQEISPSEANLAHSENGNYNIPVDEPLYKYTLTRIAKEKKPFIENMTAEFVKKFATFSHLPLEIEYGYKQFLVTTLKFGGKTLGILNFNSQKENHFENCDLKLFQVIADLVAVAVANITAREEIRERERERSTLMKITEQAAKVRDFNELFALVSSQIKPLLRFDDFVMTTLASDGQTHRVIISQSEVEKNERINHEVFVENAHRDLSIADDPWFADEKIYSRETPSYHTVTGLLEKYPNYFWAKLMRETGLAATITTTLKHRGKVVGGFFIHYAKEFENAENLFPLIQSIANQLSTTVANILANEEILERTREKSVLLSISADIASARNAVELLQIIRDKAQQLIPFYDTGILIVEEDGKHHYDLAVNLVGWEDSEINQKLQNLNINRISHSGSYVEFVMLSIETANSPIIEDYEQRFHEFTHPYFQILEESGHQEAIVGALKSGGKTFGTLWLNSLEKNHFKPEQFEIFQALADQVAVALANILANEKILERESEKSVQLAVSNALTTIHDSEALIVAIAGEINKIIPNDAFSIHIKQNNPFLNLEFNDVRAIKENGVFVPLRRRAFWKSKGIAEEKLNALIREAEPVLLEKAVYTGAKYTALCKKLKLLKLISDEFGFRSVIYAPVALQNGNLVTLTASSKQENGFTAEQLEKLCETGKQIALALESNLAFAEVTALKKRLEAENTFRGNYRRRTGSAKSLSANRTGRPDRHDHSARRRNRHGQRTFRPRRSRFIHAQNAPAD